MNSKFRLLVLLISGLPATGLPQSLGDGYTFDTPTDPRSVSMGESFVAVPANPSALMYNPAGLAGISGLNLSYSNKSLDWVSSGLRFYSINLAVGTPFGVFAARYDRNSMGGLPVTTVEYPDGNGSEMDLYAHDIAVGYAYRLPVGLALGVSAKYYDFVESASGPATGALLKWKSTPAYLFDFGMTYTLPRLHSQETVEDSITLGMCFQNIGTRWKVEYTPNTTLSEFLVYPPWVEEIQMPQYFRIGLSYALSVRPQTDGDLSPFAALISGEFRSLDAPIQDRNYYPEDMYYYAGWSTGYPETSYWGLGMECTIYEILSLRGGAAFRPGDGVEGDRDRPSFRYGAGIHLPAQRIGLDLPLTASIQYTAVPAMEHNFYPGPPGRTGTLPVFSIDIQYTGSPW